MNKWRQEKAGALRQFAKLEEVDYSPLMDFTMREKHFLLTGPNFDGLIKFKTRLISGQLESLTDLVFFWSI